MASKEQRISQSLLREVAGMDPRRINRILEDAGVRSEKRGRGVSYPLKATLKALFEAKGNASSSDRRNLALAEKAEVETAALKRELIPIGEAVQVVTVIFTYLRRLIDQTPFVSNEERTRFVERVHSYFEAEDPEWLKDVEKMGE